MSDQTAWKIKAVPGRPQLNVTLSVDTAAPRVIEEIERAAATHGIVLVRASCSCGLVNPGPEHRANFPLLCNEVRP